MFRAYLLKQTDLLIDVLQHGIDKHLVEKTMNKDTYQQYSEHLNQATIILKSIIRAITS
jgi:hypothetical protein